MVAPGTVIADECQRDHFTRFLIPDPSFDPMDPLNWSARLRHSALLVRCVFLFFGTYSSGFSVLLFPHAKVLQMHADKVALLNNYNILTFCLVQSFGGGAVEALGLAVVVNRMQFNRQNKN